MKYEIVEIKEKTLVGLKERIKEEKTAHDTIWNLWKDLYSEKGVKNVKDRKNGNLMGVYYNYSNENGFEYDCLTGCEVKDTIDKIPEEMIKIQIPEGKYAKALRRRDQRRGLREKPSEIKNRKKESGRMQGLSRQKIISP